MSICRAISCVVGKGCFLWPICALDKIVSLCPASFYTQGQTCILFQVSFEFLHFHSNPLWWKGHLLLVLVLEGLHITIQLQLQWHQWLGHRLGSLWCWVVCLRNESRKCCSFEITPKYCTLDSSVASEGYSISSKGFLPLGVDIMVIWIKISHSHPF